MSGLFAESYLSENLENYGTSKENSNRLGTLNGAFPVSDKMHVTRWKNNSDKQSN